MTLARCGGPRPLGFGGETLTRFFELFDPFLTFGSLGAERRIETAALGGEMDFALSQAGLEAGGAARRFRALLLQSAAHAGDMAVRRIEVLGERHDTLPERGALAAIRGAERFGLGRRAGQFPLEVRILGRKGGTARAQGLDLALEDRDLGTAFAHAGRKRR